MAVPILLLLAADTAGWVVAQHLLDRRVAQLQAAALRAGWRFEASTRTRGGWPLAATLGFAMPGLRPTAASGGLAWTGSRLTVAISVLHPTRLAIRLPGSQSISRIADAQDPAADLRRSLRWRGEDVVLDVPLRRDLHRIRFAGRRLQVAFPAGAPIGALRVGHFDGSLRWTPAARAVTVSLHDIDVPTGPTAAAGADGRGFQAEAGALEMSLVGIPDAAGTNASSWRERLQAWRRAGGRLLVSRASLRWPDATCEAAGAATLDGNLLPDGAFSLHMQGADALLARAVRSGLATQAQATSVTAVLGLIAAASDRPGRGSLDLPLELHAGTLSLGRIPLLQLGALDRRAGQP